MKHNGRVSQPPTPAQPTTTFYDAVGGEPTFRRLVARFYQGVANDPVLTHLDSNPIVPLATRKMLTDTLATLAKVVH